MEPRPLNKPQRPSVPQPAPGPSPIDRGARTPPAPTGPPGYAQPNVAAGAPYPGGSLEPAASRGAWYEPGAAHGSPMLPQGYSPGPALTPIDSGRGARLLGPLLALVVLAVIVGTAVYFMLDAFGDGGPRSANLAAGTTTAVAQAASTSVVTTEAAGEATQESGAVAGADETAAPSDAAGDETQDPAQTPTAEEVAAPEPTRTSPPSARSMLPSSEDFPAGFERTEDNKRTREAVAESFSDPATALSRLEEWKWRENAYRTFELPAASNPDANATTVINISIHRFGDEQGTKDALDYFAEDVIGAQGLEEFRIDRIGEQTRALKSSADGSNVVLYVRTGNYLIRIGGFSAQGDPTEELIALAQSIIE